MCVYVTVHPFVCVALCRCVCVIVCVCVCVLGVGVGEIRMGLCWCLYSCIFEKNPKHTDRLAFMLL